ELRKTGEQRELTAAQASVDLKNTLDRDRPSIQFELTGGVKIRTISGDSSERTVSTPKQALDPVPFLDQPTLKARMQSFDAEAVLRPALPIPGLSSKLTKARKQLIERIG